MPSGVYPRNKNKMYGMTGKYHTEESKQKNKESHKGLIPWNKDKHYHFKTKRSGSNKYWLGKNRDDDTKNKISLSLTGKTQSLETIEKRCEKIRGELNPNWRGGISFEPYCEKFNEPLKWLIRKRDNYQCQMPECLYTQLESLLLYSRSLIVHHVHYDKKNCEPDLITLCAKHNAVVNFNRDYWENLFMEILKKRNLLK